MDTTIQQGSVQQGKIVFNHYTTKDAAKAIRDSRVIRQSDQSRGDALHGNGTYGTPLGPHNGRKFLSKNNYGARWQQSEEEGKLEVVIRIVLDGTKVKYIEHKGRKIYLHEGDISLDEADEVDFISYDDDGKQIVD